MYRALSSSWLAFLFVVVGCNSFDVRVPTSQVAEFRYCVEQPRGVCVAPSKQDAAPSIAVTAAAWQGHGVVLTRSSSPDVVLSAHANRLFDQFATHPVTAAIVGAQQVSMSNPDTSAEAPITLAEVRDYLRIASDLDMSDGWLIVSTTHDNTEKGKARGRYAQYLGAYFKAYFRNFEFGSIGLQFSDLYTRYPQLADYKDKLDPILQQAGAKVGYGKVGSDALVTRTGRQLQFPPFEVTIDPTKHKAISVSKIDYPDVGADLVRVIVEALFDARDQLPAVQNATGAIKANFATEEVALETFAPGTGLGHLTNEQFTRSASLSNSAEGTTAALTGQLIRGGNIAALNNEAVAKALEALTGSLAAKAMEKASYCWYACVLNAPAANNNVSALMRKLNVPPGQASTLKINFK